MFSTKDRIIHASIKLFNEHGVASIRLQQIADEIEISVGNLAYHFKNKETIVQAVYAKLFEDFSKILSLYLQNPSLTDFDLQAAEYFEFFKNYQFYLTDLFASEHPIPEIKEEWQQLMNKMIAQIRMRIDFHVKRGEMKNVSKKTYDILAESIWMTLIFWIPQQTLRNKPITEQRYKEALWNMLIPYFSESGSNQFEQIIQPTFISPN